MTIRRTGRRWFAPEVVQTSAMDCGPAALKCLLEGFGIPVSYGRLREACQTDVDGTSIDTMEEIAVRLGLEAEQIMLPVDHLFLDESEALPALIVVRQPNGLTHFVVVWRCIGPFVQVMDPAIGRRWMTRQKFLEEVYVHEMAIPAPDWRDWAGSKQFVSALRRRLTNLKASSAATTKMVAQAVADSGWRTFGALDAVTRMMESLVRSGGLRRGPQTAKVLRSFFDKARNYEMPHLRGTAEGAQRAGEASSAQTSAVPNTYWSVLPADGGGERLSMKGVVLVRVVGR